jgi:hypothetical protein
MKTVLCNTARFCPYTGWSLNLLPLVWLTWSDLSGTYLLHISSAEHWVVPTCPPFTSRHVWNRVNMTKAAAHTCWRSLWMAAVILVFNIDVMRLCHIHVCLHHTPKPEPKIAWVKVRWSRWPGAAWPHIDIRNVCRGNHGRDGHELGSRLVKSISMSYMCICSQANTVVMFLYVADL